MISIKCFLAPVCCYVSRTKLGETHSQPGLSKSNCKDVRASQHVNLIL